jgi:hypothetical protein
LGLSETGCRSALVHELFLVFGLLGENCKGFRLGWVVAKVRAVVIHFASHAHVRLSWTEADFSGVVLVTPPRRPFRRPQRGMKRACGRGARGDFLEGFKKFMLLVRRGLKIRLFEGMATFLRVSDNPLGAGGHATSAVSTFSVKSTAPNFRRVCVRLLGIRPAEGRPGKPCVFPHPDQADSK